MTIPAAAWAGDGGGRSGQRSERDGDGRDDHRRERRSDHNDRRRGGDDHEHAGRRDKAHRGRPDAVTQRGDGRRTKDEPAGRHGDAAAKHRDRGPRIKVRIGSSDQRDGLVTSASVDLGNGERERRERRGDRERREETERGRGTRDRADDAEARGASRERERQEAAERERQEAEARLRAAARERRGERFRDWLDGIGEAGDPAPETAPEPTVDPDAVEVEDPQPSVEEDQTPAVTTTAPPPTTAEPTAPTAAFQAPATEAAPSVAATPSVDALAHEHGVVDRTFRAGGALLRDRGRAVIEAIPPQTRTFGIPLGLLAALGGYLVAERRFRSGHLPMSAAAVPMQEGARERHRL